MKAHILFAPFQMLWRYMLGPVFHALDRALVQVATLFGALEQDMLRRVLWMNGLFLALYAISFLPVPWLPLIALGFGYIGVLAVGRAWVANEKQRTNIVKKLDDTNPDSLPDLRAAALLSALQLLILFPLLLRELAMQFPGQLFAVPSRARLGDWLEFAFDPYAKPLIDLIQGQSRDLEITAISGPGHFLVLLKRLTLDFILIQGVMRVFAINTTIREGVGALRMHPDITVRLGARAVPPLSEILKAPAADPHLKSRAALILGELKATQAVPDLIVALNDPAPEVRWRAVTALGEIRNPQAVPRVLEAMRDADPTTARAALDALVALEGRDAIPELRDWLQGSGASPARALAAEGLRQLAGKEAVEPLVAALRDPDEEVAKSAAAQLGALGDMRATEPLGRVVADGTAPSWLRYEAAKALEALGDRTASGALQTALGDPDPALRRLAARALGILRDPASGRALVAALRDTAPEVREAAARAVGLLSASEGVEALIRLLNDPHAEVQVAAAEGLANYEGMAVPALQRAIVGANTETRGRIEEILKRLGK